MASSTASHVTVSPAEAGQYWWHFRVPFSITLCRYFWYTEYYFQSYRSHSNWVTPCYWGNVSSVASAHLLSMITARLFCCHTMLQKWPVVAWKECRIKWAKDQIYGAEVDGHLEGSLGEYVRPVDGIDCEKWRIDIVRVDHLKELAWRKMSNKRPYSRRWNNFRWGTTSTRGTRLWS